MDVAPRRPSPAIELLPFWNFSDCPDPTFAAAVSKLMALYQKRVALQDSAVTPFYMTERSRPVSRNREIRRGASPINPDPKRL